MREIERPGAAPLPPDRAVAEDAERFVEQAEFGARRLAGIPFYVAGGLALAFSGFQLYTAAFGTLPGVLQRAVHLAFALGLCFLFYPASKKARRASPPWSDYLLGGCAAWVALYVVVHHEALVARVGDPTPLDILTGAAAVLFILEASRRAVGIFLPAIASAFVLYAFVGPYLPDLVAHRGYTLRRVVDHLYFTTEGIFGIPLWVSSTFVFGFVLFGAVLERTGAGEYLIQLAFSLFGHTRGGPAKAAVVASAFMGTVSGSSIANAATVGSMTIPLMKRVGFKAEVAGGIETAAGGNGQIMPPVMGAAAFVMAEWLGIPYLEVVRAAVLPAVIDQLALLGAVHLLALKEGISGLPKSELPPFWRTFLRGLHFLLPVAVLLYYLIWQRSTPLTAAFMGTMAALGIFVATGLLRALRAVLTGSGAGTQLADTGRRVVTALFLGARTMAGVGATCACAGIIVGVVTLTGLGLNMADILLRLSGGYLLPSLFLTMLACLILGMGVPTTATYIIMATITAPALHAVAPGLPIIAIHLFVFYFGILADDTPPVGLAAYAAAGIAGADPVRTGWQAFKLDMRTFLLPFMFVTAPQMLLINTTVLEAAWIFVTASVGMYALAAGMQGYFLIPARLMERAILCASAVGLVWAGLVTDVLGMLGVAVVVVLQRRRQRAGET